MPTNLKGGSDSLFFINDLDLDPMHFSQSAVMSLNRTDRLRFIDFEASLKDDVRKVILESFQSQMPKEEDYFGAMEFNLKGLVHFLSLNPIQSR